MNTDKRAREEYLHIKYVGDEGWWVDSVVLIVASAIALLTAFSFIAAGVSADDVGRAMVWLSCPWFLALYFVSWKLRKLQITSPRTGEVGSHRQMRSG
ncbi:MAG: hypothetical protein QOH32_779 [Bradyrhizobium sp.]|jgi:hypothetical protein|nr:hypothetical protein [Bradyrhizobium sp.]